MVEPSVPYEPYLIEWLKDPQKAAMYLEAAIEEGHQGALLVALRHVAMAHGGVAAVAQSANLTREAAYRMLSQKGNPELRSLTAVLAAAGLRLAVKPIEQPLAVAEKRPRYGAKARRVLVREALAGIEDVRQGRVKTAKKALKAFTDAHPKVDHALVDRFKRRGRT